MKSSLPSLYVLPFICNCVLVSSSILTPQEDDGGLRIFKDTPGDFEYVLKRHSVDSRSEDPDSKERRSNMGSSFIRYGRSDGDGSIEKAYKGDIDGSSKVNRYPRWKSPDIFIRFGRSGFKSLNNDREYKRGRNDLNFIRYGRNVQVYPVEIDMASVCTDLMSNNEIKDLHPYEARLLRLCNILTNIDAEHRNSLDFLEERLDSKHD
ncbi:PREDICTED: FMRFamide-related peptides-like [Eufriesea mexicana]|uniref:FMRFamide-related peptides-like n=1 Tax=Eufriesea mexicana TaxID=516756 RepID=UPI00083C03B1|nr:PREDICTED: FMRFamide-related peptides-like [Eufriesea mexicana]